MGKSGNPAKAAEQAAPKPAPERAPAADEHGTEDFDAFWQSRKRKQRHTTVMGQRLVLPPALPLKFEMEARRLKKSASEDDVRYLVGILVGEDAMDAWIKNDLDHEQFQVLLAWLPGAITGTGMTLAEVADAIAASDEDDEDDGTDPQ